MIKKKKPKLGRPRKYRTEAARKKARRLQNKRAQAKSNAVRRERYHSDPSYRRSVIKEQRRRYRESRGVAARNFGSEYANASAYSSMRKITIDGKILSRKTLSIDDMAKMIGITPKAFASWVSTNKFPKPVYRSTEGQMCYTLNQAKYTAQSLYENMKGRSSFRSSDTKAIASIHRAMAAST